MKNLTLAITTIGDLLLNGNIAQVEVECNDEYSILSTASVRRLISDRRFCQWEARLKFLHHKNLLITSTI